MARWAFSENPECVWRLTQTHEGPRPNDQNTDEEPAHPVDTWWWNQVTKKILNHGTKTLSLNFGTQTQKVQPHLRIIWKLKRNAIYMNGICIVTLVPYFLIIFNQSEEYNPQIIWPSHKPVSGQGIRWRVCLLARNLSPSHGEGKRGGEKGG